MPHGDRSGPPPQMNMNMRPGGMMRPGGGRRGPGMARPVEKPKNARKTVARLLGYFAKAKKLLILMLIVVVAGTVAALLPPAIQGNAIDAIADRTWEKFYTLLVWLGTVFGINILCSLAQSLLSSHLSQKIVRHMRYDLFKKIDRLSVGYLDTHSNGDVMSRMTNDVENISMTVSQSLASFISGILTLIGTVGIMFFYCWQLTLITMLSVVLTVIFTGFMSKKMREIYRSRSDALGRLNGHAEEMITGHGSVVAYNKQPGIKAEFEALSDDLTRKGIRAEILGGSMGPVMNCISNISFIIVAAFGGYFALKGIITIGTISAFIIYAKQFSRPINEIAIVYGSVQTAVAGAERVFDLIDQPDEDDSGTLEPESIKGDISFCHVDFSYVAGKQVLCDFNLEVRSGQKIALVGATGSGKTTVVNLLMRFYKADAGQIMIDGHDIMELKRDWLRQNIAIVLQDTVLFSDTIRNNIKFSNMQADDEKMLAAARMSNSESFVERLPDKYETYLRHAGASISHGQRQLLNIARAILADPKILILDEATSSVDTRTEQRIQDAMVRLMKNRTSLIIAHRLSTIQDADQIVVMDKGRVVEIGNHDELIKRRGHYYSLYMTQFAGNEI